MRKKRSQVNFQAMNVVLSTESVHRTSAARFTMNVEQVFITAISPLDVKRSGECAVSFANISLKLDVDGTGPWLLPM